MDVLCLRDATVMYFMHVSQGYCECPVFWCVLPLGETMDVLRLREAMDALHLREAKTALRLRDGMNVLHRERSYGCPASCRS